jgi:hypothetical protein
MRPPRSASHRRIGIFPATGAFSKPILQAVPCDCCIQCYCQQRMPFESYRAGSSSRTGDIDWKTLLCDEGSCREEAPFVEVGGSRTVADRHLWEGSPQHVSSFLLPRVCGPSPGDVCRGPPPWLPLPEWSPHDLVPWSWNTGSRTAETTEPICSFPGSRLSTQALPIPESPRSFGGIENLLWYLSPDIPRTPVSWRRPSNGVGGSSSENNELSTSTTQAVIHVQQKDRPEESQEQFDLCSIGMPQSLYQEATPRTSRRRQSDHPVQSIDRQRTCPRSLDEALRRAAANDEPDAQNFLELVPESGLPSNRRISMSNSSANTRNDARDETVDPYSTHKDLDIGILMTNPSFLLKHFHPCYNRGGAYALDDLFPAKMETSPRHESNASGRYTRSIGFLTAHLLGLFAPQAEGKAPYTECQTCASLATALNVAPRRIYDVISVLEAIGILERDTRGSRHKNLSMQIRLRSLTPTQLLSTSNGARAQRAQLERRIQDLENFREDLDRDLRSMRTRLYDLLYQLFFRPGSSMSIAHEAATLLAAHIDGNMRQGEQRRKRWFLLRPSTGSALTGFWADPSCAAALAAAPDISKSTSPCWRINIPGDAHLVPVADIEATTPVPTMLVRKKSRRGALPLQALDPNRSVVRTRSPKRHRTR